MRRPGRLYDFARYTRTENVAGLGLIFSWPIIIIFAVATILIGTSPDSDLDLIMLAQNAIAPVLPQLSIDGTF